MSSVSFFHTDTVGIWAQLQASHMTEAVASSVSLWTSLQRVKTA